MTIDWTIPAGLESELRRCLDQGEGEAFRKLVGEALVPIVHARLLQNSTRELTIEEFDALLKEMDEIIDSPDTPDAPPLSDYAVSREGIYGDHP